MVAPHRLNCNFPVSERYRHVQVLLPIASALIISIDKSGHTLHGKPCGYQVSKYPKKCSWIFIKISHIYTIIVTGKAKNVK